MAIDRDLLAAVLNKYAYAPPTPAPPMDPAAMGGMPPMDPAMMGAPPMDPAMMGAPPMDPAAMGGMPPMDPAMMGMDPAMMGMDPAMMGGMPPMDPSMMGAEPPIMLQKADLDALIAQAAGDTEKATNKDLKNQLDNLEQMVMGLAAALGVPLPEPAGALEESPIPEPPPEEAMQGLPGGMPAPAGPPAAAGGMPDPTGGLAGMIGQF